MMEGGTTFCSVPVKFRKYQERDLVDKKAMYELEEIGQKCPGDRDLAALSHGR